MGYRDIDPFGNLVRRLGARHVFHIWGALQSKNAKY